MQTSSVKKVPITGAGGQVVAADKRVHEVAVAVGAVDKTVCALADGVIDADKAAHALADGLISGYNGDGALTSTGCPGNQWRV